MSKRSKFQRFRSRNNTGIVFVRLREKLSVLWRGFIDWLREESYFEYFLEVTLKSLGTYIFILGIILFVLIMALVRALLKNDLICKLVYCIYCICWRYTKYCCSIPANHLQKSS